MGRAAALIAYAMVDGDEQFADAVIDMARDELHRLPQLVADILKFASDVLADDLMGMTGYLELLEDTYRQTEQELME